MGTFAVNGVTSTEFACTQPQNRRFKQDVRMLKERSVKCLSALGKC